MLKTQKSRKTVKWVAIVILTVVAFLSMAAIYLSAKWKPLLTEKIKTGVYEASNHLYRIDFKDIHLNLLTGSAVLDSITLNADTSVFNELKTIKKAPTHLFKIKLAHLKLSRVGILTAYFKQKVAVKSIILDNPSIDMIFHKVPKNVDTVNDNKTLYEQIAKSLKSISVANIKIIDADFDYYNGKNKLNAIKHLNINVKDLLIDSLAQFDTTRVFHSKAISFAMYGYSSISKDKMYTLKVDTLNGSLDKKELLVKGFKMVPMYPDLAFSRKYSTQKDRYDLAFSEIKLSGVNFIALNREGNLQVRKVAIGPAKVAVFMNRELPLPAIDKGKNYPHLALRRLAIPTIVDSLTLKNVDIAYTEYSEKTKERGTLKLDNLSGQILNLTNDSLQLTKNNHALADLNTYIFGKGKMNVKIDFNLTAPDGAFSYVGNIGSFDMKILNPIAKSLGLVEIEQGSVQKAHFSVNANLKRGVGSVAFYYNNLKVNMLDKTTEGVKEKKGLLSFLANNILIIDNNPREGEAVRTAQVTYERSPQASFFNLMWKSVFVGIREAVGIGAVPMKKMPEPKVSTKKEERQKRREERTKNKK